MKRTLFIFISILLSCHFGESNKQTFASGKAPDSISNKIPVSETKSNIEPALTDTTSSEYLIDVLKNEKPLNHYWLKKLETINNFFYSPEDTLAHLSLIRNWTINDSISVIIISTSNGTSYDEFLITVKNKRDLVNNIHISDNDDSDLSFGNPYYYIEYKLIDDRTVKLSNHKVVSNKDGDVKDRLTSVETWTIQNSGRTSKK